MSASAAQIASVRLKIAEPTEDTFTDEALAGIIEENAVSDVNYREPTHLLWIETYDLNAAASDCWYIKAAALQNQMNFTADGGTYSAHQLYENALQQANVWRSKARAKSVKILAVDEVAEDDVDE